MTAEAQKENDIESADGTEKVAAPEADASTRERSTIEFPYSNLEEAEEGAKQLFNAAGTTEVSAVQAAAAMNQSPNSSGFRTRLASMKLFGLLEGEQGRMRLSELGRAIAEAHSAIEARAKAFARVPLYAKVIENHDGHTLPRAAPLELEFANWGVAKKQTDRARQVFERSAKHAGYIKAGSDRFVAPILRNERTATDSNGISEPSGQRPNGGNGGGDGGDLDPVIRALVQKIPPSSAPWGVDEQVMWLRMMAMAFNMTYGGKRQIKIEAETEASRILSTLS